MKSHLTYSESREAVMPSFQEMLKDLKEGTVEVPPLGPDDSLEPPSVGGGGNDIPVVTAGSHFGLDNDTAKGKDRDRLEYIYNKLSGGKVVAPGFISEALAKIESRIGAPSLGNTRLEHVYKYLKLMHNINDSLDQLRVYGVEDGDRQPTQPNPSGNPPEAATSADQPGDGGGNDSGGGSGGDNS